MSLTNGLIVSDSSLLTPINVTPLSLYFCCSSFKCGMLTLHGPHHVAQNSTTVTCLPFRSDNLTGAPLIHSAGVSGGAGSPSLAVAAAGARFPASMASSMPPAKQREFRRD